MLVVTKPYYKVANEIPFTPSNGVVGSHISTHNNSATLTNGNVVVSYSDGALSSTMKVVVYKADGTVAVAPFTVGSTGSIFTAVVALKNGNFMAVFRDSSLSLKYAIYSALGASVLGITALPNTTSLSTISVCSLASGGAAIGFIISGSAYLTVIDAEGTVVFNMMNANSLGASCSGICVSGLPNGNIVLTTNTSLYGNGAVPTVSVITQQQAFILNGHQIQAGNSGYSSVVGLPNGNFAVAHVDQTNAAPYPLKLKILSEAAVELFSTSLGTGNTISPKALCLLTNGNLAIIYNFSDGFPYYSVYSQACAQVKAKTIVEASSVYSINYLSVAGIYGGNIAAFYSANSNQFPILATLKGA